MKKIPSLSVLLALLVFPCLTLPAGAQTGAQALAAPATSALDEKLFYQLIVGEISAQDGQTAAGFALILDAARKANDAQIFQRAVELGLQSRSGDAALQAAQAWNSAQPDQLEPNRYLFQILIALNRIGETEAPLKKGLALAPPAERAAAITALPRGFARASDKKLASQVVEAALSEYLATPATAGASWTAISRMRLAAANAPGALEAAQRGFSADPSFVGLALLAIELMDSKVPAAEALLTQFFASNPTLSSAATAELRMAYARSLLDAQRYGEASAQLKIITTQAPDFSVAWLVIGSLQLQDNQLAAAQTSMERFIALVSRPEAGDEAKGALSQAYLALAQIAEKRQDFPAAEGWLAKIENSQELISTQSRRASIMAKQGKVAEARRMIQQLPERNPNDARSKLSAEVGMLRELKQFKAAYELLGTAVKAAPQDTDLLYDQAMMAEKSGLLVEMEALLRQVIQIKPDSHNAYNALGYSLADRNMRLPEARELIRKALEYVPADPYIKDSLAWVEFRLGNTAESLRIFEQAFKAKPDAEIAAHFGEVLWTAGQKDRARAIWKEGQALNPDNETLVETLKRFRISP